MIDAVSGSLSVVLDDLSLDSVQSEFMLLVIGVEISNTKLRNRKAVRV